MSKVKKIVLFLQQNKYAVFALCMFTVAYMVNQLATFSLIATNQGASQEIGYGDRVCDVSNQTALDIHQEALESNLSGSDFCSTWPDLCDEPASGEDNECPGCCYWRYLGRGTEYQLLAGPLYMVLFSISGIPMGLVSEMANINRKVFLSVCVIMWSVMTVLGGLAQQYWHLAVSRLLLGVFSAGAVPFSASMISDYFNPDARGAALGFFNWGIYVGYSFTFLLLIAERNLGWRVVYYIAGAPGILVGVVILLSVKDPERGATDDGAVRALEKLSGTLAKLKEAVKRFVQPALLLLCLGGAIRNGAGIVWAYNIIIFFDEYHPGTKVEQWMSWIPLIFGSLGAFGGGYISDKISKTRGTTGRLVVLIASTLISAPFQVGTLLAPMPWAFISHIPAYLIGEMWIGVCIAVVIDLVPADLTASSVAVYIFIIMIIGGNMNVILTPIAEALSVRAALLICFPGFYVLAALLFILSFIALRKKASKENTVEEKIVTPNDGVLYTSKAHLKWNTFDPAQDIKSENYSKHSESCGEHLPQSSQL